MIALAPPEHLLEGPFDEGDVEACALSLGLILKEGPEGNVDVRAEHLPRDWLQWWDRAVQW